MILPIYAYGYPVLRKVAQDIEPDYPALEKFIENMWETMYASNGVGLAAPQVNKDIRLFIIDSTQMFKNDDGTIHNDYPDSPGYRGVFINAHIIDVSGEEWSYNEGCLSIPKIREDVKRLTTVEIEYEDETFTLQHKIFTGLTARVILHEYDHLEGKLFIDYLSPLKKKLIKGKLSDISKGKVRVDYKMSFPER